MKKYQKLFEPEIWNLGYSYCLKNRVEIYEKQNENVFAIVNDSHPYKVNIIFNDDEVVYMDCDCVYEMDRKNCEHMAAVLIKLSLEDNPTACVPLQKIQAQSDDVLGETMFKYFKGNPQKCISQANAYRFDREFSMAIETSTKDDMMYERWENLFSTLHKILEMSNSINSAVPMSLTTQMMHTIFQRLKSSPSNGSLQRIKWIHQHLKAMKRLDFLIVLLENAFTKDQEGLRTLNGMLDGYHKQKNFQVCSYCLKLKIQLMKDLKFSSQDILSSISNYKNFGVVKDYEIECDIHNRSYAIAKEKLLAYLRIPSLELHKRKELIGTVMHVSLMLKEYDNYLNYLFKLYENSDTLPMKYLKDLLEFARVQNEYEKVLMKVTKSIKLYCEYYQLIEIYMELELYDNVLYEIYHSQELDLLIYNESILREYDTKLYNYVFYYMIITEMQNATNYNQFYDLYNILSDFVKSVENKLVVSEILIYAKEHFFRKKHLIELLDEIYGEAE
ncbi:SWIM zinc finger family protein [Amedibacillus sp. YH-ame6]